MNKLVFYTSSLGMMTLLASCGQSAQPNNVNSNKVTEARQFIHDEVAHNAASARAVRFKVFAEGESAVKAVDITSTKIKITTENNIGSEGKVFLFSLKQLTPGKVCDDQGCLVSVIRDGSLVRGHYVSYEFSLPVSKDVTQKAEQFSYALSTLQQASLKLRSTDPEFLKVVDNYKSASPKPTVPPTALQLQAQGEEAVKNRHYNAAVDDYTQALDIAPWWPEAHYNLALNLAKAKDYKGATDHAAAVDEMKCYLLLAPDGKDAQNAQDKIDEWQGKTHKDKWYKL